MRPWFACRGRDCESARLSEIAWSMFGKLPFGWGRVQAIWIMSIDTSIAIAKPRAVVAHLPAAAAEAQAFPQVQSGLRSAAQRFHGVALSNSALAADLRSTPAPGCRTRPDHQIAASTVAANIRPTRSIAR